MFNYQLITSYFTHFVQVKGKNKGKQIAY